MKTSDVCQNILDLKRIKVCKIFFGFILGTLFLVSCGNVKRATYFYGTENANYRTPSGESLEPVVQKNDLLSISVSSINPEAAEVFNTGNVVATQSSTISGATTQVSGYLVDQDGLIRFPILGTIKAAGKTKKALREEITKELIDRKLLIEPIVDIRYLNFKISVLGEVNRPSVLTIPNEKVSLFEALGLAGDITIYGNKENIVLMREKGNSRILERIDLTSSDIFYSPYYYLESNDVIYVEPVRSKVSNSSGFIPWIPVVLSGISLAIVAVTNLR